MANEKWLTDEEVETEIAALQDSPFVKLARKELRLKYKRRQRLYQLRNLEKRGKHLDAEGITADSLEQMLMDEESDDI